MTRNMFVTAAVLALALGGCGKAVDQKPPTPSATKLVSSVPPPFAGPYSYQLPDCSQVGVTLKKPTKVYRIDISDNLDIYSLPGVAKRHPANANGDDEDDGQQDDNADVTTDEADHPTRWDFYVNLQPPRPPTDPTYELALIKIKIAPGTQHVRLRGDDFTIRAGDDNGRQMFCGLKANKKLATFTVYYLKGSGSKTFGSFNIGLYADDKIDNTYNTPIFIDPSVKNHG